jgi:TPR repeat protein
MSLQVTTKPATQGTRTALAFPLVLTGLFLALGFFSRARTNSHLAWTFIGVAAFLLCWQCVLFLSSARRASVLTWEFVPVRSHYVQALVQFSVYLYWGWYWREVYAEAPLILSQVVFLYIFDALLTWLRGQTWRLGFGPWPIVFSTNLFMWFRDDWFAFQFLMVAMGVLGKQFVRWKREGKLTHIFNPSALALTIVSLVLIFTGTSGYTWGEQIATTQGRPPHLYMEIFLCGLVVQYFFSVTLLTFSAAAAIGLLSLIYTKMTGVYLFFDSNIPIAVFLGLHLLMTDPATTPRRNLGKIMFGALYGAGVFGAVFVLNAIGAPGFYDKLVVVPILNLLTPALDRVAAWGVAAAFGRWEDTVGPRKMNLAYMAGWLALFLAMLATGFVEGPHPGKTIGFWEKAAEENRPQAVKNLRFLLNEFTSREMDYPAEAVGMGDHGAMSQEQALGILCNQVASIYAEGRFVPADPAKAAHYFDRACELGNTEGCAHLAVAYFSTNLAGTQVDIGRALSKLEQSAAASNDGRICCLIGYAYSTGRGLAPNKAKARQFYEKGAALGVFEAWKTLAHMQLVGEGGATDHAAAAFWLQKAADARDGPSCLTLARLYHNGDGVPRDEQKAVALLERACALGIEPACLLLQESRKQGSSK